MSSTVEATITSRLRWDHETSEPLLATNSNSYKYVDQIVDDYYKLELLTGTGVAQSNRIWYETIDLSPGTTSINLSTLELKTFDGSIGINFHGGDIKAVVIQNTSLTDCDVTLPFNKNGDIFSGANNLAPSGKLVLTNAAGWRTRPNETIDFVVSSPTTIKINLIGTSYHALFGGTILATSSQQSRLALDNLLTSGIAVISGLLSDSTFSISKFASSISKSVTTVTQGTITSSPMLDSYVSITGTVAPELQKVSYVKSHSNITSLVDVSLTIDRDMVGVVTAKSSTDTAQLLYVMPSGYSKIVGECSGELQSVKNVTSIASSLCSTDVSLNNEFVFGASCEAYSSADAILYTDIGISGTSSIIGQTTPEISVAKFANSQVKVDSSTTADLVRVKGLNGIIESYSVADSGLLYTDATLIATSENLQNDLLSFYRLEEQDGTRYDEKLSNNLLTYNSEPGRDYGVAGYSASFSGIATSGLYLANGGDFTFESDNFTMAAWVKPTRQSGTDVIASIFSATPLDRSYEIFIKNADTARFYCYGESTNSQAIATGINFNEWNLIVARRDYTNNLISISVNNNTFVESSFDEPINSSTEDFQLGGYYDSLLGLDGNIDLFGVWDRALNTGETSLLWNDNRGWNLSLNTTNTECDRYLLGTTPDLTSNLFSLWKFNELSGERANSSDNAYHLSENSGVSVSYISSRPGFSAKFSGVADHVLSSDEDAFSFGGIDFSMSCWVRFTGDMSAIQVIMGKYNTTTVEREYAIQLNTVPEFKFNKSTDGTYQSANSVASTSPVVTGEWYHVVGIHDATNNTMSIVVNNTYFDNKYISSTNINQGTSQFVIGGNGNKNTNLLYGYVDTPAIWKKVLTTTQLTYLYNDGKGWDDVGNHSLLSAVSDMGGTIVGRSRTDTARLTDPLTGSVTGWSSTDAVTLDSKNILIGYITGISSTNTATISGISTTLFGSITGTSLTDFATLNAAGLDILEGSITGSTYSDTSLLNVVAGGTNWILEGSITGSTQSDTAILNTVDAGTDWIIDGSITGVSNTDTALISTWIGHILEASITGNSYLDPTDLTVASS